MEGWGGGVLIGRSFTEEFVFLGWKVLFVQMGGGEISGRRFSGEGEVFLGGGDFLQPSISYHCKVE